MYQGKTHLKCYNFFQKYEDYFTTTGAKGQNRVLFAATFLKNTALFYLHQYQQKGKDKIDVSIT